MLKIGFASILFFFTYKSYSQQQGYLILIDAENGRPFHARIGDKVFSSSDAGHLIIPNLKDSTYILSIGFPGNQYPEQRFAVRTDKKDQGFQLRNRQEEWVLYNWQTSESQKPLKNDGTGIFVAKGVKKDDSFSRLMAAVVNDTAVLYNTYIEERPADDTLKTVSRAAENVNRPDTVRNEQEARTAMEIDSAIAAAEKSGKTNVRMTRSSGKTDTVAKTDTLQATAIAAKADTPQAVAPDAAGQKAVKNKIPSARPTIRKLSERPLKFSLKLVYLDGSRSGPVDTIAIYVPYDKPVSPDSAKEKTQIKESEKLPAQQALPAVDSTKGKTGDKQKQTSKRAAPADSAKAAKLAAGKKKKNIPVSDCKNLATDYDLALLRVDILTANSIDDKIKAAGAAFKTKCFSISQIKTLGELFASDESRYKFYNAAYPYISDRDNFSQLLSQLSDKKYIKRFREIGK